MSQVLEHVGDDRAFIRMTADLLAPGGIAVFTVDFSNRYPSVGRKPAADFRLYTTVDLRDRLMAAAPDCGVIDTPSWQDGVDDFDYDDCCYAFASWVFRKLDTQSARGTVLDALVGTGHWKEQLLAQRKLYDTKVEELRSEQEEQLLAQSEQLERQRKLYHTKVEELRSEQEEELLVQSRQLDRQRRLYDTQIEELRTEQDSLVRQHEQRLSAIQAEWGARIRQIERTVLMYQQREPILLSQVAQLHQLLRELTWPDGPRALRAVLPFARLIRWIGGRKVPHILPEEAALAAITELALSESSLKETTLVSPPPKSRRSIPKHILLALYIPVRPLVRPFAWRIRTFLTAELQTRLRNIENALAQIQARSGEQPVVTAATMAEFGRMLEITLLALALDHPRDRG